MGEMRAGRLGIGVIGMGHVGPVIASSLRAAGHSIVAVSAASQSARERADVMLPDVPVEEIPVVIEHAEVVILAVPDDQIAPLVEGLSKMKLWRRGQILIHLSGAHGTSILEPAARCGVIPFAIHPAMTFTGWSVDIHRLVGTSFAVTGPAPFLPIAQALVVEMGGEPVIVEEENRPLYHASLAFGANYLATLAVQSRNILHAAGIQETARYLRPLLHAAVDRALDEGTLGISGPVVRADSGTITRHINALTSTEGLHSEADTYVNMASVLVTMLEQSGQLNERQAIDIRLALIGEGKDERRQS